MKTNLDYQLIALEAKKGMVLSIDPNDFSSKVIVSGGEATPDGIVYDAKNNTLYWTNMGKDYNAQDGYIEHCLLDGSSRGFTIPVGGTHTPKQITLDPNTEYLYWCDREGMKILRAHVKTKKVEELLNTCDMFPNEPNENRYCVGIALDIEKGHIYWTMKGPSKGGTGRILCADYDFNAKDAVIHKAGIRVVFDKLPEPIDLEIDYQGRFLYWSDRGAEPNGNSLNRVPLDQSLNAEKYEVLVRGFKEAIGFTVDVANQLAFVADLSGSIYRINLKNSQKQTIFVSEGGGFTGLIRVYR